MAYTRIVFENGNTPLNETNLNKMDTGIKEAHDFLETLEANIAVNGGEIERIEEKFDIKTTDHDERLVDIENDIGEYDRAEDGTITIRLNALESDKADKATTYTKTETENLISTHDGDSASHPDLQNKIANDIALHDTNDTAHDDIRIQKLDASTYQAFIDDHLDLDGGV